jgi:hypothetical protein
MNAFETSDSLAAIGPALAKAQGSVEGATKGKVNPAFKSKYADLASVWEACRDALTENGLSVVQSPGEIAEGRMGMTTMLLHGSGEWIRGHLTIPLGKVDAQAYGSAVTYARRYALAAFVGVAPEDDDGAAATKAAPAQQRDQGAPSEIKPPTLAERADRLVGTLNSVKTADELRKAYELGSKLCADLDRSDPERLAEINALYEARFVELTEKVAA